MNSINNPFAQDPSEKVPDLFPRENSIEMNNLSNKIDFKTLINYPDLISEILEPGDVIFNYTNENFKLTDFAITTGQKFENSSCKDAYKYTHVAIYLGNSEIAQADVDENGIDIKINKITDDKFIKTKDEYRVFRPSKKIAHRAAELGEKIARRDLESTLKEGGEYSYSNAILSIFRDSSLTNEDAVKRYFKAAYCAHVNEIPADIHGIRNFFCSYLVGWILQASDSVEVIEEMNKSLSKEEQIIFPNFIHFKTHKEKGEALDEWARIMAKKHILKIQDATIKLDPKSSSVQKLVIPNKKIKVTL